jgi:iron(III) transport system permease protein
MIGRQQTAAWRNILAMALLMVSLLSVAMPLALLFADITPPGADRLAALQGLLTDPALRSAALKTIAVALLACVAASLVAVPLAILASRGAAPVRWLIGVLGMLPLIMPAFLTAALARHYHQVWDPQPSADAPAAFGVPDHDLVVLIVVFALHYFPVILFCVLARLASIDRTLEESARNLGAATPTVWWRVVLPLAGPGYLMGVVLVLLRIIEDAATPLVLGVDRMLAPQLLLRLAETGPFDAPLRAGALVLLLLSALLTAMAWSALQQRPGDDRNMTIAPARWRSVPAGALLPAVPLVLLASLALLPLAGLTLLALGGGSADTLSPADLAITESIAHLRAQQPGLPANLLYLGAAGALTLLGGWVFGAAGAARGPLPAATRCTAQAMLAVPGVVLAMGYLLLAERLGQPLSDASPAWVALAVLVAIKQLPWAQRLLTGPLQGLRRELAAARDLGAGAPARLLYIGLPALAGLLTATFLLGAMAGLVELSAALALIQDPGTPYVRVLFDAIKSGGTPAAWAAPGLALVLTLALASAAAATLAGPRNPGRPPAVHSVHPTGGKR